VIAGGAKLPTFDLECPLMSVPAVLGTTEATIPADIPYLFADPALRLLDRRRYEHVMRTLDDIYIYIGRLIGGWVKADGAASSGTMGASNRHAATT
jgi:hypothetical protein